MINLIILVLAISIIILAIINLSIQKKYTFEASKKAKSKYVITSDNIIHTGDK